MSASWLDHLPSRDRENIRRKMRSPEAYEKLRERVKGPDDLAREMQKSEQLADVQFALASEPQVRDKLKSRIEHDLQEQGMDALFEKPLTDAEEQMIRGGKFSVSIEAHPVTQQDQLVVIPEGTVQETIPLTARMSDVYVSQLLGSKPSA